MRLSTGDTLLCYTDGITESFNPDGEWWGEEAMAASAMAAHRAGLKGQAVIDHLLADVRAYSKGVPAGDDVTLLVISIVA
jgi:sigma-B regulation protein RsbU (phosphoserine phosphatase)